MKGRKDITTNNNENNALQFLIKQSISKINTVKVVEVQAVYEDSVDIKQCLNLLDGDLNSVEPNIVYNVPFFTLQSGKRAIKILPEVGDWGIALICDSNINKIKASKVRSNPDDLRKFCLADSLYMGSIIKKQTATEYLEITPTQININSTGKVQITSTSETIINASACKINCPTTITGLSTINGDLQVNGNITSTGTTTASNCISGTISGLAHTHGGVTAGTSNTGAPQ